MTMGVPDFLRPAGFSPPSVAGVVREGSAVIEAGMFVLGSTLCSGRSEPVEPGVHDPVMLVPGFLAGDPSLAAMAARLRRAGLRTYRSGIMANVGCTSAVSGALEARLEKVATSTGRPVQIVGHSLGGLLARGLAVRRPDLISSIVTLGSPLLAPGAHHLSLSATLLMLTRLNRWGWSSVMAEECVGGDCARRRFAESRTALPPGVGFTSIYSRRDAIIDWRACLDPAARTIEVTSSHVGMAIDPTVIGHVLAAVTGAEARAA